MFDSHAHLTSDAIIDSVDALLSRAQNAGVKNIVNICTNPITLERGITLAKRYPWVYNAASTTPHDADTEGESVFPLMEKHAKMGDLIAIGETGLDYYYYRSTADIQQHFLRRYLKLALECRLPVIIHCRDAFADLLTILDEEYCINGIHPPGILHCFTGTKEEAAEIIARGWYVSFSGVVTFKKSDALRAVVETVPLEQLLIETDTPYIAPQSQRGKTNEPAFIQETAATIAMIKCLTTQEIGTITSNNAKKIFNV